MKLLGAKSVGTEDRYTLTQNATIINLKMAGKISRTLSSPQLCMDAYIFFWYVIWTKKLLNSPIGTFSGPSVPTCCPILFDMCSITVWVCDEGVSMVCWYLYTIHPCKSMHGSVMLLCDYLNLYLTKCQYMHPFSKHLRILQSRGQVFFQSS